MYRWLLRLYPASFRNEYGQEMQAVFARQQRDARTSVGRTLLWLRVVPDTCINAAIVHWDILEELVDADTGPRVAVASPRGVRADRAGARRDWNSWSAGVREGRPLPMLIEGVPVVSAF